MELPRLRYDERLAGWLGVVWAMKREAVTRANCDAGRFTRGPVLDVRDAIGTVCVVATCRFLPARHRRWQLSNIAQFCRDGVLLAGQRSLLLTQHVAVDASLNWTSGHLFWDDYICATLVALTRL